MTSRRKTRQAISSFALIYTGAYFYKKARKKNKGHNETRIRLTERIIIMTTTVETVCEALHQAPDRLRCHNGWS